MELSINRGHSENQRKKSSRFMVSNHFFVDFLKKNSKKGYICDFKLASISGITGSQIHYMAPGRSLADRSRLALSGEKNNSSTRLIYDRFMTPGSANFRNPYKIHLRIYIYIYMNIILNLNMAKTIIPGDRMIKKTIILVFK